MKFGQVADASNIDFSFVDIPQETLKYLQKFKEADGFEVFVGYPKWSKADLKGFYPRGTKDELRYYSEQFNAVEFNGTFYRSPSKEQILTWKERTTEDFRFCPKFTNSISHYSRLNNTDEKVEAFVDATVLFEEKLGMAFLQMPENFRPKVMERVESFMQKFPKGYPLAFEVRHAEWYNDPSVYREYLDILRSNHITNTQIDTPGRRDTLTFQLTSPVLFVRFVSTTPLIDQLRLQAWVSRIKELKAAGLQQVYFFIHQRIDAETAFLSTDFNTALNRELGTNLPIAHK